jgi:hypothetical protein
MDTAAYIISKFGGVRPLARLLKYPPSTVQNWETRNNIPSRQQQAILKAAIANNVPLDPAEFFDIAKKNSKNTNGHRP